MDKKIFVIHGKGEKDGLGRESGGDLDTVGSNAFYGAWFKEQFDGRPIYGKDFEFDFVNYQEGLRHLDIHEGCEVYIPDFPIDALAPRLVLRRMRRQAEPRMRTELYEEKQNLRRLFYNNSDCFPEHWKTIYNDLIKQIGKINGDRKFYEIKMAREYSGLVLGAARQLVSDGEEGEVLELISNKLMGEEYQTAMDKLKRVLDSDLKRDCLGEIPQEKVNKRLLLNDSSGFDFSCRGRLNWHEQLIGVWVEGVSVFVSTCFMMDNLKKELSDSTLDDFRTWLASIKKAVLGPLKEFRELVDKIREANPGNENIELIQKHLNNVHNFWKQLSYAWIMEDYQPQKNILTVQLAESESGRPVSDLELVFNVKEGRVQLSASDEPNKSAQSISLLTDEEGKATVQLDRVDEEKFGIAVTHNDLDFLTYPEDLILTEDYFDEHPSPESVELRLVEYLTTSESSDQSGENIEQIEAGEGLSEERAVGIKCDLIESDLRYLVENNVRVVRFDDHHPYTPAVLERLEDLKEEGLLEEVVLSSLPRGEEQPQAEQKCGADLIYEQFIEDTSADNSGLKRLREEAHVQDLHIRESELAIEISKLIGSKYNKIEMVRALMEVESESEMTSIMSEQGWDEAVAEYEAGLEKVLPRVEKTLYHLRLIQPPEDGEYSTEVGWRKFLHPVELMFGDQAQQEHLMKELYASNTGRQVDIYCALSPFCNQKIGEPTINVASALNYLNRRYDMDYYFYAYGSFLFSTRRVNEEGFDIDLSNLVSKIGSPSDGGHAAAATGSPENNPAFPKKRFGNVSDRNFAEYLYYILDTVCDVTGLELLDISEQYPEEFEAGMENVLRKLDRNVYNLKLSGSQGTANICITRGVYTGDDEPDISVPLAAAHLSRKYPMDYFFYSVSPANLIMRNLRDYDEVLDLGKVAQTLGTNRDGGHPRAASCQPKFHPDFDISAFGYVNYKNMGNYVNYLGERMMKELDFEQYQVKAY